MAQPSLDDVKVKLRQSYLGKGGIHALGVSRATPSIQVYVSPEADEESELIGQMREAAKPYPLVIIREERPSIEGGKLHQLRNELREKHGPKTRLS